MNKTWWKGKFGFKFKHRTQKTKDKNKKCVRCKLNGILLWKHENNIKWLWCKIVPKFNVE
jgi:hypothetical protein